MIGGYNVILHRACGACRCVFWAPLEDQYRLDVCSKDHAILCEFTMHVQRTNPMGQCRLYQVSALCHVRRNSYTGTQHTRHSATSGRGTTRKCNIVRFDGAQGCG